jgi:DNA-binding Lrp family transcriptional regulator
MTENKAEYITNEEVNDGLDMFWQGKPREIPSVLSGFTPAPDVLIRRYGYVTALVWGRVWRYCQMSDSVCRASLEKIAGEIGMSERTVIRHLDALVAGNYLKDKTPELKNKPHVYVDTGKIRIRISIEATMTESQPAMTQSQRQGDRESVEESIKKQSKKEKIKEGASAQPKATDFPEVVLFRSVTGRYPSKDTFQIVVKAMRDVRVRVGRDVVCDDLVPFWEAWRAKGYRNTNLSWLTEWAVSGSITNGNGNKNGKHIAPAPPRQSDADLAARRAVADALFGVKV